MVRNQADSHGEVRALSHAAWLMQVDEDSGVAALNFTGKFDSRKETGYRLERMVARAVPLSAMRSA